MANKKKPESAKKTKAVPVKKKKTEAAQTSAPQARVRIESKELLRRIAIAALALLCCFGVVFSALSIRGERLQKKIPLSYAGVLQQSCLFPIGLDESQVRSSVRATKRHGQTYAFTYFCSQRLQLSADSMSGYILFGNPAENDCTLVLTILDKNDHLIYRSDGVEPGNYITQIRPFFNMEGGVYPCKAYVSGYTGRDFQYKCVGVQYSRLDIEVGGTS